MFTSFPQGCHNKKFVRNFDLKMCNCNDFNPLIHLIFPLPSHNNVFTNFVDEYWERALKVKRKRKWSSFFLHLFLALLLNENYIDHGNNWLNKLHPSFMQLSFEFLRFYVAVVIVFDFIHENHCATLGEKRNDFISYLI